MRNEFGQRINPNRMFDSETRRDPARGLFGAPAFVRLAPFGAMFGIGDPQDATRPTAAKTQWSERSTSRQR